LASTGLSDHQVNPSATVFRRYRDDDMLNFVFILVIVTMIIMMIIIIIIIIIINSKLNTNERKQNSKQTNSNRI